MKRIYNLLQIVLAIVCVYGQAQEQTIEYSAEKIIGTSESYEFTSEQSTEATTSYSNAATTAAFANSNEAGSTAGSLSVSMTGTANYTIPIMVPPGIKDVAPQLSLSYSSQSSNGLAGWGWDISGLSTISRVAATEYYDGFHDGIDFNNDRFALDGQRLILKSGSYGSNGSVYETENYSNIKVRAYGTSPYGGPSYFIVFYPNGARAWYGQYSGSGELEWAINKWQDNRGNSINYIYSKNGGLLNIHSISYGKYGHTNKIDFKYKTRKRPEQVYVGGRNYTKTKLLDEIKVYAKTTPYRRYKLAHDKTSLDYERLSGVQEFNSQNKAFQPIQFYYGNTQSTLKKQSITKSISSGIDYKTTRSVSGDFDGDGHMDLALYNKNSTNRLNLYTGLNTTSNISWNINTGFFQTVFPSSILMPSKKISSKQAITTVNETLAYGSQTSTVRFKFYELSGYQYNKTWQAPTYVAGDNDGNQMRYKIPKQYLSGDFDGDGLTDVLAISKPYTYTDCQPIPNCEEGNGPPGIWKSKDGSESKAPPTECVNCESFYETQAKVYFIDLDRFNTSNFSNYSGQLVQPLKQKDVIRVADFNGDGRQDIYHFSSNALSVYTLNKDKTLKLLHTRSMSINFKHPILLGDYNGDGKTDVMMPEKNSSYRWKHYMSTGTSFTYVLTQTPVSFEEFRTHVVNGGKYIKTYVYERHYTPQDYNGDGKTDILKHNIISVITTNVKDGSETTETHEEKLQTYVNQKSTSYMPEFKLDRTYSGYPGKISVFGFPSFMDLMHNDGRLEYAYISKNDISYYTLTKDHKKDIALHSVSNNGVTTRIQYETLGIRTSNQDIVYESDQSQIYPYININRASGYKLVKKLTESGAGIVRYQDFYYKGAVSHIDKGFLGFLKTKRSNWYGNGVGKLWTISNHDPTKKGAVTTQFVSSSPYQNNSYISKTTTYFQTVLSPKKVFKNIPYKIVRYNHLTKHSETKTFVYDSYNNPLEEYTIFKTYGYKVSYVTGSYKVNYVYSNNPNSNSSSYHIGRVIKKKETNKIGSNTFTSYEEFIYGSSNLVEQHKVKTQTAPWTIEKFTYDTHGNITKKQLIPYGLQARTEYFSYDTSGRFLIASKSIDGMKTQYTYDVFGNPKSTTNPYNQTTTFNYDGWGRLISERNFLGKYTYFYYTKYSGGGMSKRTKQQGGKDETVAYNALGWVTQTSSLGINNERSHKFFRYDVAGRTIAESEPWSFKSGNMQWSTISYDQYGREIVRRRFNGQTVNTSYYNNRVTVNDGTKTVITTKDGQGNITRLQDPGGTITYTYHGNGTMKTANYGGNVVQTYIDNWGRKSKLIDPSAGTYTYKYNSIGEVLEETTPKGKTTYAYDVYGKVLQKKVIGSETNLNLTYTYNNTTKLLTKISGYNGRTNEHSTYNYWYDSHKRLYKTSEKNGKAHFWHYMLYDSYGRVYRDIYYSRLYSGNVSTYVKTTNVFDSCNGEVVAIKDSNTNAILWKLNKVNARGQAQDITLGNGMTKKRYYDAYGHLAQITDRGSSSTALSMKFSFDARRGNLLRRFNYTMGYYESFNYDNLDRLTQVNGPKKRHQSYDNRGRITNNSNVGQYSYAGYTSYRLKNIKLNTTGNNYYKTHSTQDIVYNAFKKPVSVKTKNKGRATFEYGVLQNRSHAYYRLPMNGRGGKGSYQKHYSAISPVEIQVDNLGNTKIMTYIGGDAYSAPIVHLKQTKSGQSNGFHYLHRDYLGSILAITNSSGTVLERRQFGAWGTVDKFIDHKGNKTFTHDSLLNRGYTGHEHFFEIDLIHMNGRMYDANLGRFLSPDNYIQEPFNTQNFNRYGYVLNNPLSFVDPDGEIIWFVVAAVVGAYIGGAQANGSWNPFDWDWSSGSTWMGMLGGAVVGTMSLGIGNAVAGALAPVFLSAGGITAGGILGYGLTYAISGAAVGAFTGGMMSQLPGGSGDFFGDMYKGAVSGFVSGFVLGAAVGVLSTPKGHSIWTGKDLRPNVEAVSTLKSNGIQTNINDTKVTDYNSKKINAEVNGDFELAKKEWNTIKKQYGIEKEFTGGKYDGFTKQLPDGSTVNGQFYMGGNTNPNGYNIKIDIYYPKPPITKTPNVYIRYKKPPFKN